MRILTFDTETTALRPGQICQLAYVINDGGRESAKNYWFTVDEMSDSSFAVHGLSLERLTELSGGKRFCACAEEILADFCAADIIAGHNVSADIRFLRTEVERMGKSFPQMKTFCTMNHFTSVMMLERRWPAGHPKPPKLSELASFLEVTDEAATEACKRLFDGGSTAHDARFDAALTHLCIVKGIEKGYINI